jgi:hypothetical protein
LYLGDPAAVFDAGCEVVDENLGSGPDFELVFEIGEVGVGDLLNPEVIREISEE